MMLRVLRRGTTRSSANPPAPSRARHSEVVRSAPPTMTSICGGGAQDADS